MIASLSTPISLASSLISLLCLLIKAPNGRYSYVGYLMDGDSPFCGGTLIAPDVLLTAGKCIACLWKNYFWMLNKYFNSILSRSLPFYNGGRCPAI
jgi:hypothetical protein